MSTIKSVFRILGTVIAVVAIFAWYVGRDPAQVARDDAAAARQEQINVCGYILAQTHLGNMTKAEGARRWHEEGCR